VLGRRGRLRLCWPHGWLLLLLAVLERRKKGPPYFLSCCRRRRQWRKGIKEKSCLMSDFSPFSSSASTPKAAAAGF
jgi:hypothetical protein